MPEFQPVDDQERNPAVDVLRGISLLGIFVVNMLFYQSPYLYVDPYEWFQGGNRAAAEWIQVLCQSSFYPIFALLFGYGLMVLKERAAERGAAFSRYAQRRLLVLLFVGMVHAFLIWAGDILIPYAVFGLMLLPLLKWDGKILVYAGAVLYFMPHLLFALYLMVMAVKFPNTALIFADLISVQDSIRAYAEGSFAEISRQRWLDWKHVYGSARILPVFFAVFPLMAAGAGIRKEKWFENRNSSTITWVMAFVVCLAAGLSIKLLPVMAVPNQAFVYLQQTIGGAVLSGAYIALVMLVMRFRFARVLLKPLAKAGKMPLSIYIGQSLAGTFIFYAYGLGLYGKMAVVTGIWLAITIFLVQVLLAELWLMRFRRGPLEAVVRALIPT
ncbi:DUF418 domain-containing protein [Heyndrickxia acidiproducens]|uniref:DUF418 domain-containing protein n=1 Tax=Heyndrickxia acidiproducens TaxID=1121084 RepID=UPI00035F4276|nr:DUF418 domain-containing protein [Heyndrickxia acidiproducens]